MKRFTTYINEETQINEVLSFILTALCGAVILRYTVKTLKGINKVGNKFWNWAIGENLNDNNIQIIQEKEFDKSKVQPMQVPDDNILNKLMNKFKSDVKKKKGFYIFDQLFSESPELKKINKSPYYANYVVFMDAGDEKNPDIKPNFYGMLGFSVKYWGVVAKKGKDEKIKEIADKYKNYINIFAVQTFPKYAKNGLFEVYLNDMKNAVKEVKGDGLTIKYGKDNELSDVFAKYGFEKIEGLDGYMALTTNKQNKL